jgi:hypothetical protein
MKFCRSLQSLRNMLIRLSLVIYHWLMGYRFYHCRSNKEETIERYIDSLVCDRSLYLISTDLLVGQVIICLNQQASVISICPNTFVPFASYHIVPCIEEGGGTCIGAKSCVSYLTGHEIGGLRCFFVFTWEFSSSKWRIANKEHNLCWNTSGKEADKPIFSTETIHMYTLISELVLQVYYFQWGWQGGWLEKQQIVVLTWWWVSTIWTHAVLDWLDYRMVWCLGVVLRVITNWSEEDKS